MELGCFYSRVWHWAFIVCTKKGICPCLSESDREVTDYLGSINDQWPLFFQSLAEELGHFSARKMEAGVWLLDFLVAGWLWGTVRPNTVPKNKYQNFQPSSLISPERFQLIILFDFHQVAGLFLLKYVEGGVRLLWFMKKGESAPSFWECHRDFIQKRKTWDVLVAIIFFWSCHFIFVLSHVPCLIFLEGVIIVLSVFIYFKCDAYGVQF